MDDDMMMISLSTIIIKASSIESKERVDDADGFYSPCIIHPAGIPELDVTFPTKPGDEPMVAFPLQLRMGFLSSSRRAGSGRVAFLLMCRQGNCCGPRHVRRNCDPRRHAACLWEPAPYSTRPPKTSPGLSQTPVEAFGSLERPVVVPIASVR
jgi:hypothetical protein